MLNLLDTLRRFSNFYSHIPDLIDAVIGRDSSYLFLRVGISTSGNYQTQLKIIDNYSTSQIFFIYEKQRFANLDLIK